MDRSSHFPPGFPRSGTPSRRVLLRDGAAIAGACAAALTGGGEVSAAQDRPAGGLFEVKAYGATGERAQNATAACQAAIDACTAAGGGTVRVPPGQYSVGMIQLKDNVTLHVEAGATLFLIQDTAQFPRGPPRHGVRGERHQHGLTGRGTLDGLAQYEFVRDARRRSRDCPRD